MALRRRRPKPIKPSAPIPAIAKLEGSGTAASAGPAIALVPLIVGDEVAGGAPIVKPLKTTVWLNV
jgi:hypothetical protein